MLKNRIRNVVPEVVREAIAKQERSGGFQYSAIRHVFHCFQVVDEWVGVCGDADNGGYEWFLVRADGSAEFSNCGYGMTSVALREVLNRLEGDPDFTAGALLEASAAVVSWDGDAWRGCMVPAKYREYLAESRKAKAEGKIKRFRVCLLKGELKPWAEMPVVASISE